MIAASKSMMKINHCIIPSVILFDEGNISDLYPVFQIPAIPLYLGADVFSNTNIRTENHPRYHAKFAKKGLATKITFSSGNTLNTNS